jgi:hypothetical protein
MSEPAERIMSQNRASTELADVVGHMSEPAERIMSQNRASTELAEVVAL